MDIPGIASEMTDPELLDRVEEQSAKLLAELKSTGETSLEFGAGDSPDYAAEEPQHVEEDYLPILYANWRDGDIGWEQGYVVTSLDDRFDNPDAATVMVMRITAQNEGALPAPAKLWVRLAGGDSGKVKSAIRAFT